MYITTDLSAEKLAAIVTEVSDTDYSGNLNGEVELVRGRTKRFKMGTRDSHADGSRTSWTGRHGRYACWHAFRDVLAAILLEDPKATIRTGMATYGGAQGFLDTYPGTADQNVGSMVRPAYMDELCIGDTHLDNHYTSRHIGALERAVA